MDCHQVHGRAPRHRRVENRLPGAPRHRWPFPPVHLVPPVPSGSSPNLTKPHQNPRQNLAKISLYPPISPLIPQYPPTSPNIPPLSLFITLYHPLSPFVPLCPPLSLSKYFVPLYSYIARAFEIPSFSITLNFRALKNSRFWRGGGVRYRSPLRAPTYIAASSMSQYYLSSFSPPPQTWNFWKLGNLG